MTQPATTDNVPVAVATILLTVFAMAAGDALVKSLGTSASVGLWQLFALRSLMVLPVLFAAGLVLGLRRALVPRHALWASVRAALLIGVWIAYYTALPHVPLSAAAAALYTLPLFIVGLSAVFTEDRVTPLHALAALLGFIGVALVLRPGGAAFSLYALLPILAAFLFAAAMVLARVKCRHDHPLSLALMLHLAFILAGGLGLGVLTMLPALASEAFLAAPWVTLSEEEWQVMALLAASILIASVGTALAYQKAPGSIIGTFEFAYVGFAVLWGIVLFDEWPDGLSMLGLLLIVTAGILAIRKPA